MNAQYHKIKAGFTLVELLVVITIIAAMMAILLPAMARARLTAKVLVASKELSQIGLALDAYEVSNNSWPLVRPDCGKLSELYSLPPELIKGGYLPGHKESVLLYNDVEDEFYAGHSYRYLTVGPTLSIYGKPTNSNMTLYMPAAFPADARAVIKDYSDRKQAPVKWIVFSLGPNYDTKAMENAEWRGFPLGDGFPFLNESWYNPKTQKGILTYIKTNRDQYFGTFQSGR